MNILITVLIYLCGSSLSIGLFMLYMDIFEFKKINKYTIIALSLSFICLSTILILIK